MLVPLVNFPLQYNSLFISTNKLSSAKGSEKDNADNIHSIRDVNKFSYTVNVMCVNNSRVICVLNDMSPRRVNLPSNSVLYFKTTQSRSKEPE
jgi:hypothetical protein